MPESQDLLTTQKSILDDIEYLDSELSKQFKDKFLIQPSLNRSLVSFQANKTRGIYRWYKYKEAFSASLIEYLIKTYNPLSERLLDPFAGIGTSLFVGSSLGIKSDGIELLPIGQQIILSRKLLETGLNDNELLTLKKWLKDKPWQNHKTEINLNKLRITQGAYSEKTQKSIEKYMSLFSEESDKVQSILRLALLCILESVSYTRKDGQYLRWDYRSGRQQGKKTFDKGKIADFDQAICEKITEIIEDLQPLEKQTNLFSVKKSQGEIQLYQGSSLEIMPQMPDNFYDKIITSPPYCNRYDYTRTYALELALLGVNDQELINLRQQMLSCTVENRAKDLSKINLQWKTAIEVADQQKLLQLILQYLFAQKDQGKLNNNGIPRMVKGYFYEMACIIAECSRVMKSNSLLFMINDNVRYAGASISVDMILSNIAEKLGFSVESILVLPNSKGNSSQQMSEHGRESLRKCVYIWRKL